MTARQCRGRFRGHQSAVLTERRRPRGAGTACPPVHGGCPLLHGASATVITGGRHQRPRPGSVESAGQPEHAMTEYGPAFRQANRHLMGIRLGVFSNASFYAVTGVSLPLALSEKGFGEPSI